MPRSALITVAVRGWTGWTEEQPKVKSVQLGVEAGQKLTPARVGIESAEYEILVDWVGADRIMVMYRGVVMQNPDGTINLTAPAKGRCLIKTQCCLKLATATMDAGTFIAVTLDGID